MIPVTVSIIIGAYNNADFTELCLNTIFEHENSNPNSKIVEVFVHSNGSIDRTNTMLEEYQRKESRLRPVFSDHPLGYSRAVNYCVPFCTGEYILFLNNDCNVFNDYLDRITIPMSLDPDIGLGGVVLGNPYAGAEEGFLIGCYLMAKRHVLQEIGLFCESFEIGYHEDEELCLRAKKAGYKLFAPLHQSPGKKWTEGVSDTIDFPLNHFGSATFRTLTDNSFIGRNEEKWKYLQEPHVHHVTSFINSANDLLKLETLKAMNGVIICAIVRDHYLLNQLYYGEFRNVAFSKNVYIIPCTISSEEEAKMVGENFNR